MIFPDKKSVTQVILYTNTDFFVSPNDGQCPEKSCFLHIGISNVVLVTLHWLIDNMVSAAARENTEHDIYDVRPRGTASPRGLLVYILVADWLAVGYRILQASEIVAD
ncbi:hypothetical protein J6590_090240 [Homalodisca vitripennis]|nr:hypothetical protein J6590_090240 [Homalodisca vitripennis]